MSAQVGEELEVHITARLEGFQSRRGLKVPNTQLQSSVPAFRFLLWCRVTIPILAMLLNLSQAVRSAHVRDEPTELARRLAGDIENLLDSTNRAQSKLLNGGSNPSCNSVINGV